jgi:UDP-N-acetylglucosamine kinase
VELEIDDKQISEEALKWAKKNKKSIARKQTDTAKFSREREPVSVFMSGSPGAGKTEASKALLEEFDSEVLRIDPDEFRELFDAYEGNNSWLFQPAVSVLVEKIHDLALKQDQSFVLDGTLANYQKAENNIKRSLNRDRLVQILYVYQKPELAWEFVQAREKVEGRKILPDHFINQYFEARNTVNRLKKHFKKDIKVDLLLQNYDNSRRLYKANIDLIDNHVPEKHTHATLETLLGVR